MYRAHMKQTETKPKIISNLIEIICFLKTPNNYKVNNDDDDDGDDDEENSVLYYSYADTK
jgi:hypothetical protein